MTRPTPQDRIRAALWFAERGFGVFSCWSTRDDGTCRCPSGGACSSPGKHPITPHGFQDATRDPARIRTLLTAGSEPNYGLVPPEGVCVWDVDTDDVRDRLAALEARLGPLPATLRTDTGNGQHVFWRWPEGHPRPLHAMFGIVTRWGTGRGQGYVIGPRSVHHTGREYRPAGVFDIATLPDAWATAALEGDRLERDPGTIRIGGTRRPEDVEVGGRHDYLRDRARHFAGTVRDPDALFAAVWALNLRFPQPKTEEEVRRAIGDALERFPEDAVEEDPETGRVRVVPDDEPGMLTATDDAGLFPPPPAPVAYGGLLGECVDFLAQGTDASPVGLLASLTAFCGALMPAWAYWNGRHTSSPFLALVGKSAIGRKGTAMYRARDALGHALQMDVVNRVRFDGLASGEALVKALLDRSQATYGVPTGVLFEEEYATFLAASGRDSSSLDPRMRSAFDGKQMAHRQRSETMVVPEPYFLSGLVSITPEELQDKVDRTAFKSGSGNRWLWLPVMRRPVRVVSTEPVLPLELSMPLLKVHQETFRDPPKLTPAKGVDDLLGEYEEFLRSETVGLAADMTRRYGVIAFRCALVHASVERSATVTTDHVSRSVALCEYARAGLDYVFGDALGDQAATHLLRMLRENGGTLTQGTISKYFLRDPLKRQAAIDDLQRLGLAEVARVRTSGRNRTELRLMPGRGGFRDFRALFGGTPSTTPRAERAERAEVREDAAQRVRRRSEKVAEDPPAVDVSTGETDDVPNWWSACSDYAAHRDSHRNTANGWVCTACNTALCGTCAAGPFLAEAFLERHRAEAHP